METGLLIARQPPPTTQSSATIGTLPPQESPTLAAALATARQDEAALLEQERLRADRSLAAARRLFISAGVFGSIATLLSALLLARRLNTPLRQLSDGVKAYQSGDFGFRLGRFRDAEFSTLAGQLNVMAAEVQAARKSAADRNTTLEAMVATRTSDLQLALEKVSGAEDMRKQLLADIGHELRTPVTIIRGEAQVALRDKDAEEKVFRATLERIIAVSRQMGLLIENLLDAVRTADPPNDGALHDVSLQKMLTDAVASAKGLGVRHEITVDQLGAGPDLVLITDPDRLRQVLVCMLDNTVRYSYEGGSVTLDAQIDAGSLSIAVRDYGIGIAPADIPTIWDRGWRAATARAHRADGLGLGLAIAGRLARSLGGDIKIFSAGLGHGTTATLYLPLNQG